MFYVIDADPEDDSIMYPGPVSGATFTLTGFAPVLTGDDPIVFNFPEAPTGTYYYTVEKEGYITATGQIDASEITLGEETWIGVGLLQIIDPALSSVASTPDPSPAIMNQDFSFTVELKDTQNNPILRNYPFYEWNFQAESSGEARGTGNAFGDISVVNVDGDGLAYTVTLTYDDTQTIDIYVQVDGVWLDDVVTVNVETGSPS